MTTYAGFPLPICGPGDALAFDGTSFLAKSLDYLYAYAPQVPLPPFNNPAGRVQRSLTSGASRLVAVFSGQSPIACCSDVKQTGQSGVLNFNILDGKFYDALDPLLGCSTQQGGGGWPVAFGNLARACYDEVVLVPIGVDGQDSKSFYDGPCAPSWAVACNRMAQAGIAPNVWFWQQGNSDFYSGTSAQDYGFRLRSIIAYLRMVGITCPFGIIKCSWIGGPHDAARQGQDAAVSEVLNSMIAYDSDAITGRSALNGAHWDGAGIVASAGQAWAWTQSVLAA